MIFLMNEATAKTAVKRKHASAVYRIARVNDLENLVFIIIPLVHFITLISVFLPRN